MNKGIFYLFLAGIGYALMGVLIRTLNTQIPPFSQMFLRYIGSASLSLIFVYKNKDSLIPKNKADLFLLVCMGFFGYTLSTIFFTYSVLHAPLSTVLFIFTTYVIITPLLTFIFLKEKLSRNIFFAVVLSTVGTFFLFRPDLTGLNIGAIYALLASLSVSFYYVCSRKLKQYPSTVITTYSILTGLITVGILSFIFEPNFYQINTSLHAQNIFAVTPLIWLVIFIFALDNFLSWMFTNKGFQTVKGGIGSIILLTEPVLGTILGLLIYGETLSISSIIGIIAILGGILLVTLKN